MFRVESSSGESDSSASSRESVSSGGSDMVIIHRTMSGMYKVLDSWIKQILPVLPDQSLQVKKYKSLTELRSPDDEHPSLKSKTLKLVNGFNGKGPILCVKITHLHYSHYFHYLLSSSL